MHLRPQSDADLPALLALHAAAFADEPIVEDLVRELSADPGFLRAFSLVAEEDGALLGHVLFTRAFLDRDEGAPLPLLALAPLAVAPAHQHHGIGTALVTESLARAKAAGETVVVVVGDPAYYSRFGFVPAGPSGVLSPFAVEVADAWMVVELEPDALTGAAGVVRYAPPLMDPRFW